LDTLKDLRKKHDQLLEICKQKQKDIVHMKDNINTIKAKEDQILKDKSDADRKLSDLQATLANLKGKLEEAV
jgi:chromosome segregation ATPase